MPGWASDHQIVFEAEGPDLACDKNDAAHLTAVHRDLE